MLVTLLCQLWVYDHGLLFFHSSSLMKGNLFVRGKCAIQVHSWSSTWERVTSCGIVAEGSAVSDRRSPDISMTASETQGILWNGREECKSQRKGWDSV